VSASGLKPVKSIMSQLVKILSAKLLLGMTFGVGSHIVNSTLGYRPKTPKKKANTND